ncbi:MAG: CBS domain-containing protein [Candidatus Sumerlaeaceae bacterium]
MTSDVVTCSPADSIQDAATLMSEKNVGVLPVTANSGSANLIGVVTDRDIACRGVAKGLPPNTPVEQVMSAPMVTIGPEATANDCQKLMEENQVRRVLVADKDGKCIGVVAQADIARALSPSDAGATVQEISRPTRG